MEETTRKKKTTRETNSNRSSNPTTQRIEPKKFKRKQVQPIPTSLSSEQLKIITELLKQENDDVVSQGFFMKITKSNIACLKDRRWLNDEVINFFMNLITERSKTNKNLPNVVAFNTFFYQMMRDSGYQRVRKWTTRANVDVFSLDVLVVPVHLPAHWCLGIVDFSTKELRYYDSLGGINNDFFWIIRNWMQEEHLDKKGTAIDLSAWKNVTVEEIPHQENGYDCGVFLCTFADFVSSSKPLIFDQDNMPYFRQKMILDILNKSIS